MNASDQIDQYISEVTDWRGNMLAQLRDIIRKVDPRLIETLKWGSPVWSFNGDVCSIGAFKTHVKINFFKGAHINDSEKIFNNGLESKNSRSVDFQEGDKINEDALLQLIKSAIEFNLSK